MDLNVFGIRDMHKVQKRELRRIWCRGATIGYKVRVAASHLVLGGPITCIAEGYGVV
ncbi:hypothetical protein PS898_00374 [Pseudomonas fluorescens]|nr:hypothetical protein PS898_00374 [Pseudomonas fluorescens]